jgi:hypothetical protein
MLKTAMIKLWLPFALIALQAWLMSTGCATDLPARPVSPDVNAPLVFGRAV